MDFSAHFKGKRITVMGLGVLGRAVNDAKFLAEQGAELIVTDLKADDDLRTSLDILKSFPNVRYRLGGHDLADFKDRDFILKAAGVPLDSLYIAEARKNGIPIKMSASWFAESAQIPIVGVTGTRGKTTTTYMLYDIMQAAGMHVLLGGNIRGVSTLALLPEVTKDSIGLFELDSWQCQGWGEAKMSPHIAVFTTFMRDHMNYYHDDMNVYFNDKAQIFLYQKPGDTLIASEQVLGWIQKSEAKVPAQLVVVRPAHIDLSVPGEHNQLNAACALGAARALGIADAVTLSALAQFKGVAGRLELLREVRGIKIYNDTTSTTAEATLAALDALGDTKRILLIMGGADKKLDMTPLLDELPNLKRVVVLQGTGTERILAHLGGAPVYDRLQDAVHDVMDYATEGDIVLFSPAFASFGMFKNEYDRGDQFNSLVWLFT